MKLQIEERVRKNIRNLVPYSSARDEYSLGGAVFLDANENPYNSPYNRYPDPHQVLLKERIAAVKNVPADRIFAGNGSDEAIDLLYRVFCEPGRDNAVAISPSYGMYRVCADVNHIKYREVSLNSDYSLDTQRLIAACDTHTGLLFICSPNNPTSNSFAPEEILEVADSVDAIVVVDEAYIDFSPRESLLNATLSCSNLVVLQTFSKAWGMAGIRLGIAVADPLIIRYMSMVKYPYNVNSLTQEMALRALEDRAPVKQWVKKILEQRERVSRSLKKFRFVETVFPSDANFLLVKVRDPREIYDYLVGQQIIVRDRSRVALCEGSLRITIGSEAENDRLLDALREYQRDFVDN